MCIYIHTHTSCLPYALVLQLSLTYIVYVKACGRWRMNNISILMACPYHCAVNGDLSTCKPIHWRHSWPATRTSATRAVSPGPAELCRKHRTCVKSLKVSNGQQLRIKAERSAPAPPRPAHETRWQMFSPLWSPSQIWVYCLAFTGVFFVNTAVSYESTRKE